MTASATWDEEIAAAKVRLAVEHVAAVRRLRVEGMSHGAWMLFGYDVHGYLEVLEVSPNIQYQARIAGPGPGSAEINAAWELAYETAPRDSSHVAERWPPGTELSLKRYVYASRTDEIERCVVVKYSGSWASVRFDDGDMRGVPVVHLAELERARRRYAELRR